MRINNTIIKCFCWNMKKKQTARHLKRSYQPTLIHLLVLGIQMVQALDGHTLVRRCYGRNVNGLSLCYISYVCRYFVKTGKWRLGSSFFIIKLRLCTNVDSIYGKNEDKTSENYLFFQEIVRIHLIFFSGGITVIDNCLKFSVILSFILSFLPTYFYFIMRPSYIYVHLASCLL